MNRYWMLPINLVFRLRTVKWIAPRAVKNTQDLQARKSREVQPYPDIWLKAPNLCLHNVANERQKERQRESNTEKEHSTHRLDGLQWIVCCGCGCGSR